MQRCLTLCACIIVVGRTNVRMSVYDFSLICWIGRSDSMKSLIENYALYIMSQRH